MNKFYVQLANRKDGTGDCPEIPVVASDKYEAQNAYMKFCGILSTEHKIRVMSEDDMTSPEGLDRVAKAEKLAADKGWECKA